MKWIKQTAFAMTAWLAASEAAFAYCAMCQTALANSPEGQQLASGMNNGILFLLGAPFLVTGLAALLIVKAQSGIQSAAATSNSDFLPLYPTPPKPTLPENRIPGVPEAANDSYSSPSTHAVPFGGP